MDFGLGEGIAHHNRTFRCCKSLNIHFHHLSIATMLTPNQPYSHSEFTSPTGLAGWQNFKLRNNKSSVTLFAFPFLYHSSFDSLMQYTPWTSKDKWNTTASARAYNAHGSCQNSLYLSRFSTVHISSIYINAMLKLLDKVLLRMNHCTRDEQKQEEKKVREDVNNLK